MLLSILLVGNAAWASDECDLAVSYLLEQQNAPYLGVDIYRCTESWQLVFERIHKHAPGGQTQWEIIDLLEVPKDASDEVIVSETCSIGGVEDKGIVVVARNTNEDWFQHLRVAWRADKELGRWIPIDARTVRCWNEVAGFS